jgi:DNA-binding NarL/FixJ family response regulator
MRKGELGVIRVVIADDHHLVRHGIRALLEGERDIEVIGEASDGQQAVDLVQELTPEIIIIDLSMPRLDGVQATERILAMDIPTEVVILSVHDDAVMVKQLLNEGIKGYLLKESVSEELALAVRSASAGRVYISPAISNSVLTTLMATDQNALPENQSDLLTPREREVLQLIAEGFTNNAIAEELTISVKTVEKHRANLMAKLDVHDLPTLIRKAIEYKLIFMDQQLYSKERSV